MTSKQRAKLKGLAAGETAAFQIGKGNISDNMLKSMNEALDKRELIKISVLKGAEAPAEELIKVISGQLKAEPVCVIGNKMVLYRFNEKASVHIEL